MDNSKKRAGTAAPKGKHWKTLSLLVPLLCLAAGAFCLILIADMARDNIGALMQSFRLTFSR